MKKIKSSFIILVANFFIIWPSIIYADNAEDEYVYVSTKFGISEPVIKSFSHDETNSRFRIKQSNQFGISVGYSFYPGMMIELSAAHQPKYIFKYTLPETAVMPGVSIPETSDRTKVSANIYTLNLIYEIPQQYAGIKPYLTAGGGIAKVSIKPKLTTTDALAGVGMGNDYPFFRATKSKNNCPVLQFGGGITYDFTENVSIDLGAKLMVVNGIKFKYDTKNDAGVFVSQSPIKKTIGVADFMIGVKFKIPA
ncbi:MAG: outer membrane protein [Rickettsiaceae bacterium]